MVFDATCAYKDCEQCEGEGVVNIPDTDDIETCGVCDGTGVLPNGVRVMTYTDKDGDVKHITDEEYRAGKRMPEGWKEYVWHERAETVEIAIANHDKMYEAYLYILGKRKKR